MRAADEKNKLWPNRLTEANACKFVNQLSNLVD